MKRISFVFLKLTLLVTISSCASTWESVKKDSANAWEKTKEVSSDAVDATKKATKKTKKALSE